MSSLKDNSENYPVFIISRGDFMRKVKELGDRAEYRGVAIDSEINWRCLVDKEHECLFVDSITAERWINSKIDESRAKQQEI